MDYFSVAQRYSFFFFIDICQRKEALAEAGRLQCPFHCPTPAAAALPAHCVQYVCRADLAPLHFQVVSQYGNLTPGSVQWQQQRVRAKEVNYPRISANLADLAVNQFSREELHCQGLIRRVQRQKSLRKQFSVLHIHTSTHSYAAYAVTC